MSTRAAVRVVTRRFSPLALLRMTRGLRQGDVARESGIHESTVGKIETGARRPIGNQVQRLAQALKTNPATVRRCLEQGARWANTNAKKRSRP